MGARRPATLLTKHRAPDPRPPRGREHSDFNRRARGAWERTAEPRSARDQGRQPHALARASTGGGGGGTRFHSTPRRPATQLSSSPKSIPPDDRWWGKDWSEGTRLNRRHQDL